jgi:hypothetical protein
VLDIFASGNGDEEFWYSNTPEEYVDTFGVWNVSLLGQGTFREVLVYIDDDIIGVVSPFEVVFTGGVCPGFWRPIVGHRTFDLPTYPIDLTPFIDYLRNETHRISFRIQGQPHTLENWYISGYLQIWHTNSSSFANTSAQLPPGGPILPSRANITTVGRVATDNTSFSATTVASREHLMYSLDYTNQQTYQLFDNGSKLLQNVSQATVFNSSLAWGYFNFDLQVEQVEKSDGTGSINAVLSQVFHRYTANKLDGSVSLEHAQVSTVGELIIGKKANLSRGNTSVALTFTSPKRQYTRVVSSIGHRIVSDYEVDKSVGLYENAGLQFQGDS